MTDDTLPRIRLALRGHTLAAEVPMRERGAEIFVGFERPPPVRSLLEVDDGNSRRFMRVERVVESPEGERGFFGRFVDAQAEPLGRVGTEHLAAGDPSTGIRITADGDGTETAASYPVPAPVLDDDQSAAIDIVEQASDDVEVAEGPGENASGRGKKRKGRRRG